jgi:hypothetical protein
MTKYPELSSKEKLTIKSAVNVLVGAILVAFSTMLKPTISFIISVRPAGKIRLKLDGFS